VDGMVLKGETAALRRQTCVNTMDRQQGHLRQTGRTNNTIYIPWIPGTVARQ
jgi:hypothetical protein